ncbi:MAG TPA: hypothetical protein VN493_03795 [Thermoanaerobaculia bacterium]|nr:hypothetical protein [Thermoanaerobaculia bacterium]
MKKSLSAIGAALILLTASLPAAAHPLYPDMIDIAGPYSVRIGTGGIGIYLAPRGVDTSGPIDRGAMPASATQVFVANFRPGTFFTNFPSEHVVVILWGAPITLPGGQLEGRGVALGPVPGCNGIAIEQFRTGSIIPESCLNVNFEPSTTYELIVHASAGWVYYRLANAKTGVIIAEKGLPVPDQNPYPGRRDLMVGHTADDRYEGVSGSFEFFNVYDGYY